MTERTTLRRMRHIAEQLQALSNELADMATPLAESEPDSIERARRYQDALDASRKDIEGRAAPFDDYVLGPDEKPTAPESAEQFNALHPPRQTP